MDTQQLTTITFDNMASSASPQFLNPDDLTSTTSPSPSPAFESDNHNSITMTTSPDAVVVHSKPAKKRKSWGQALPEPKTMLPPRKRAKTDDEKEQRRIERIKRNRAAAHNSRERKRQETETLAVALARANAELNAYRSLHGPLPSHIVLPEVTLDNGETPVPSLMETEEDEEPSPDSPAEDLIKQEPVDSLPSFMAPNFEYIDAKASTQLSLDPTQHSAVSVEPSEQPSGPSFNNIDFSQLLGNPLPASHDASAPDLLQDYPASHLEPFAFADGALDASLNPALDFSFDDFIHHDDGFATVAVDGHGAL